MVWRWLALACVALALCSPPSANAQQARRIYLFEGMAPWQPGGAASLDAFRQRLKEKSPVEHELYLDYLDLGRFPGKAHEERLVRFLGEKFAQNPPHLLVPNGPRSLSLLARHRDAIAPGVPIVYCCASADAVDPLNLPRDVLGVILEYNWAETLALAVQLQPGARNLVLISGASELDRIWRERALSNLAPHLQRYEVRTLFDMAYDDVLKELARLPRDTIVLHISLFADAAGQRFFQNDLAMGIAAASSAPIYSALSVVLGRGPVGGYMHSFEDQGIAAADIALDILAGKDPATLPRQTRPLHKYTVDANALKRWGIPDSALPPDTVVLFRQPTVWDQYRAQIIAVFIIVLLQAALIGWLLLERYRRFRAAEQAGKAKMETGQYRESLAHLMRVHAVGEMSTAIAHEVNQPLAAIKNYAFAARRRLAADAPEPSKVEDLLDKIETQASRAGDVLHSLRTMVKKHEPEPTRSEVGRLISDTLKLVEMECHVGDIRLESSIAPDLPPVFVDEIQIQQVVLNLTRNAIEAMEETGHAGTVSVGVHGNGHGEVAVSVADSGPGIAPGDAERIFDPFYSTKEAGLGVGLSISRAIIEAHGGRLSLTPNAGGGSVFRFTLPALNEGV
jgi:signal transduction histidine kinase